METKSSAKNQPTLLEEKRFFVCVCVSSNGDIPPVIETLLLLGTKMTYQPLLLTHNELILPVYSKKFKYFCKCIDTDIYFRISQIGFFQNRNESSCMWHEKEDFSYSQSDRIPSSSSQMNIHQIGIFRSYSYDQELTHPAFLANSFIMSHSFMTLSQIWQQAVYVRRYGWNMIIWIYSAIQSCIIFVIGTLCFFLIYIHDEVLSCDDRKPLIFTIIGI